MKKIFNLIAVLIALVMVMIPAKGLAAMPDISAGKTDFDMMRGLYILTNKVKVTDNGRTITAEKAVVSLKDQKVWANGDVTLNYDNLNFKGDKIFVRGLDKTAEAVGTLQFNTKNGLKITADYGTFNWGTKEADFYGRVKVSGAKKIKKNVEYAHVKYNVVENKFVSLDQTSDDSTEYKLTETDPTEQ